MNSVEKGEIYPGEAVIADGLRKLDQRRQFYDAGLNYIGDHPHEADVLARALTRVAGGILVRLGGMLQSIGRSYEL